jgi:hypothetical protein
MKIVFCIGVHSEELICVIPGVVITFMARASCHTDNVLLSLELPRKDMSWDWTSRLGRRCAELPSKCLTRNCSASAEKCRTCPGQILEWIGNRRSFTTMSRFSMELSYGEILSNGRVPCQPVSVQNLKHPACDVPETFVNQI